MRLDRARDAGQLSTGDAERFAQFPRLVSLIAQRCEEAANAALGIDLGSYAGPAASRLMELAPTERRRWLHTANLLEEVVEEAGRRGRAMDAVNAEMRDAIRLLDLAENAPAENSETGPPWESRLNLLQAAHHKAEMARQHDDDSGHTLARLVERVTREMRAQRLLADSDGPVVPAPCIPARPPAATSEDSTAATPASAATPPSPPPAPAIPGSATDPRHPLVATLIPTTLTAPTTPAETEHENEPPRRRSVRVQPPHDGVHDSLYRILEREIGPGAGRLWPQFYELNHNVIQPDGHTMTDPSLIKPNWVFVLPDLDTTGPGTDHPSESPGDADPTGHHTGPPTIDGAVRAEPGEGGVELGKTGTFIAVGLAAAAGVVGVAAIAGGGSGPAANRWAVARPALTPATPTQTPDPRPRPNPLTGPFAQHHTTHPAPTDYPAPPGDPAGWKQIPSRQDHAPAAPAHPGPSASPRNPNPNTASAAVDADSGYWLPVGADDTAQRSINLPAARGLGVVGPNRLDILRAAVMTALHASGPAHTDSPLDTHTARVLITRAEATTLFGPQMNPDNCPPGLRIEADTESALGHAQVEMLRRARRHDGSPPAPPLMLVFAAPPPPEHTGRLQGLTEMGATHNISVIIAADWPTGLTLHTSPTATVTAQHPPHGATLVGTRLYRLREHDADKLLQALRRQHTPVHHTDKPGQPAAAQPDPGEHTETTETRATDPKPDRAGAATAVEPVPAAPEWEHQPEPTPTAPPTPPARPNGPAESTECSEPAIQPISTISAALNPQPAPCPGSTTGSTSNGSARPLVLRLLGHTSLTHRPLPGIEQDTAQETASEPAVRSWARKQREVLAYLALHRDGVTRESLAAAVWPDTDGYNSFHATLSQLRRAIRVLTGDESLTLITHQHGLYRINPDTVEVDLWQLDDTLSAHRQRRQLTSADIDQLDHTLNLYRGDYAAELDTPWLLLPRQHFRRRILDTISGLADHLDAQPEQRLTLLEHARTIDPTNENLYLKIAIIQAQLGHHESIPPTLHLLQACLAQNDTTPTAEITARIVALAGAVRSSRLHR